MCVRYTLHRLDAALAAIAEALEIELALPEGAAPRYNVAPSQVNPVVAKGGRGPELRGMMWGYASPAGLGRAPRPLLPTARSETVAQLPTFRESARRRRCLVPANGFYEWGNEGGRKQPHLFALQGEEPFAFAGVWEEGAGGMPETYCILTTSPNAIVARIHHRMPVILTGAKMGRWLGDAPLPAPELSALVQPFPAERMTARAVNRFVNNSRHEGPQCLAPPDEEPTQMGLELPA